MTTTYLDTPTMAPSGLAREGVVDHLAQTAAAMVRASLRAVAAVVPSNRDKIVTARWGGLNRQLMRDIGINHRDEVLFAAPPRQRMTVFGTAGKKA